MAVATTTFKRLTAEQRQFWDDNGYLILKNAISPSEVAALTEAVDRVDVESQRQGRAANEFLNAMNVIEKEDVFLNMIDHPNSLGVVADVIGANIHLLLSQVLVRPPTPEPGTRWHCDGPKPYPFPYVRGGLTPLYHLKIGWFLTDVDKPDMGNFLLVPGSHVNGFPTSAEDFKTITSPRRYREVKDIDATVPGVVQVTVNAGDAFMFHNALWHSVSRNTSNVRRKNLYYVYAPQWTRLYDRLQPSPQLVARSNPVRQQLLGALGGSNGGINPGRDGAPLVELFEQKPYEEVWEDQIEKYAKAWVG